ELIIHSTISFASHVVKCAAMFATSSQRDEALLDRLQRRMLALVRFKSIRDANSRSNRCQCPEPEARMPMPRVRLRTSGSKGALESQICQCPFDSEVRVERAAMCGELWK